MYSSFFSEREKERLGRLDKAIQDASRKRISYLRDIFRERGLIAPTLGGLTSESGSPFVEEELQERGIRGHDYYTKASVRVETRFGPQVAETAYLCVELYQHEESEESVDGCGWVKGKPEAREYSDLAPLGCSAGTQYYCRVCGKFIGETRSMVS